MAAHLLALEEGLCLERPHLLSPCLSIIGTESPGSQWAAFHPKGSTCRPFLIHREVLPLLPD